MRVHALDLVVSAVLFRTAAAEIAAMVAQVATIPLRTLLILVDNDPDEQAREERSGDVLRIWTGANLGYGRGHNIAIERSAGMAPLALIANTDIRFAGPEIAKMCAFMEAHPDIGLAAPRVRYPDGRLQHLCRLLPTPTDLIGRRFFRWTRWGRQRDAQYELKTWHYDRVADIPFLSGCFLLARRSVLDEIGGFDPRFFLYWEDLDLSRRIHERARTVFLPDFEIVHSYRSQQRSSWRSLGYLIRNAIRYFVKWGWWHDPDRDRINAAALAALELSS